MFAVSKQDIFFLFKKFIIIIFGHATAALWDLSNPARPVAVKAQSPNLQWTIREFLPQLLNI